MCSFVNVSVEKEGEKRGRRGCKREESIMCDSYMIGVEDGIYGRIVSGGMEGNEVCYSFLCSNNTFLECYRSNYLYHDRMNEEIKDSNYTYQTILTTTSSYIITNCTFTQCTASDSEVSLKSPGNGGALYFYASTLASITITSSLFSNCSASGYGGAIFCCGCGWCVMSGCSIDECTQSGIGGGALFMGYTPYCTAVKDSNITSCVSSYAGGLFLQYNKLTRNECEGRVEYGIVSGCSITECNALTSVGGGLFMQNTSVATIRSCSFCSCKSATSSHMQR